MIVLYIPFSRGECGDLGGAGESWQRNHLANSNEAIKLIYYQDKFDDTKIEKYTSIYIIAHSDGNRLANFADTNRATNLDIETLAARFNSDLVLLAHKIHTIHVYCCGAQAENSVIAEQFQSIWYGKENNLILYYAGRLFAPDNNGIKWSLLKGVWETVESRKFFLKPCPIDDDEEQENLFKLSRKNRQASQNAMRSLARFGTFQRHRHNEINLNLDEYSDENEPMQFELLC